MVASRSMIWLRTSCVAEKVLALLQTEGGSLRRRYREGSRLACCTSCNECVDGFRWCVGRYLQWLVQDQGSLDSYHHTELALSLARAARSSLKDCTASSPASSTILYSNVDPSHTAQLREVFQNFLESSSKYAPELILQEIQNSELWHEQVVTLRLQLCSTSSIFFKVHVFHCKSLLEVECWVV